MADSTSAGARSALFNQSIEKAFVVLGLFDAHHSELSLSEIARLTDMSMGSVQRITHTLEQLGYLVRVAQSRKYRIGIGVLGVGAHYLEANLLIDCANPYLSDLSNRCLETVSLTEPCGLDMVYVARFTSRHYIPIHMPIGSRVPMFCTASGRAYLSALDDATLRDHLERSERIAHTANTVTEIEALMEIVQQCRQRGLAWNNAEYFRGDINIAAPVINASGRPVAAVHVTAPASRWQLENAIDTLGPPLLECARAITQAARTRR